ncbi:unnamed protein product [Caenorhabditis bovis]|uniref:F-box domain-containing protein n=1 Tax=Caenorhabditis bovis TaxID=2654633 RepID=A0A8S1EQG4_9PELO|nr:unnamed protein product [Caenorhabditis bovis]
MASIHCVPCEVIHKIFEFSNPLEVPRLRLVCNAFNRIIKRNYPYLPRVPYIIRIFMEDGQIMIAHKKSGNETDCAKDLFEFDFDIWREISIVQIELVDFDLSKNSRALEAFQLVYDNYVKTRQASLRQLTLINTDFKNQQLGVFEHFINAALETCEKIVVENCTIPINFDESYISKSKFDHFRWINSSALTPLPSDQILQKITMEMKNNVNKRTYLTEIDQVAVKNVCDFIEEWLQLPVASFFNFTFNNCDEFWKSNFLLECERRKLTHFYMEFQSKAHANAHVKVSFSQNSRTCCIWPVVDVPARTTGQSVCYARYFRDF